MGRILTVAAALMVLAGPALAQKPGERLRTYDALGRLTGTAERGGGGTIRTFDAQGRREGTIECRGNACTRYDAQGRRTGRIERR
jgi:YD repeat-containing protein